MGFFSDITNSLFGSDIPSPPGFSSEEQQLLQQSQMTYQQMLDAINRSSSGGNELQQILQGLSGFYNTTTIPSTPDITTFTLNQGKYDSLASALQGYVQVAGNRRNPFTGRPIRGINEEAWKRLDEIYQSNLQTDLQSGSAGQRTLQNSINQFLQEAKSTISDQNKYGVVDSTIVKGTEGKTETTINQEAVNAFRQKLQSNVEYQQKTQELLNKYKQQYAENILGLSETESQKNQSQIEKLQQEQLLTAMKGEQPVRLALQKQKQEEYRLLKENSARTGNPIIGDTPESAMSLSTAGQKALESFNTRWGLLFEQERENMRNQGITQNINYQNLANSVQNQQFANMFNLGQTTDPYSQQLNLLTGSQNYGASQQANALSTAYQLALQGLSPYSNQRQLGYQSQLYQYGQNQNMLSSLMQLGGMLGMGYLGRNTNPGGSGLIQNSAPSQNQQQNSFLENA